MPHLALIKMATNVVVTTSVSRVVGQVIKANTNPETLLQAVQLKVGKFAIGGLVAGLAWDRTEVQIDKGVAVIEKIKDAQEQPPSTDS